MALATLPSFYATRGSRTAAAFDWEVARDVALCVARTARALATDCRRTGQREDADQYLADAMNAELRADRHDKRAKAVRATPVLEPATELEAA